MSFGTQDLSEIALKTAALPKKNSASPRIVVFTQGAEETIVAVGSKIQKFAILPVATEKIVDTTGAGDAFVGGFLSQLAQGAALEQSIAAAHYVASIVIQRSGPSYPDEAHAFKFAN